MKFSNSVWNSTYIFVLESDNGNDRSKDFIFEDFHAWIHVGYDGGLEVEIPLGGSAHHHISSCCLGAIYQIADALKLVCIDQRTLVHFWIHAIAQDQIFRYSFLEFGYEGIVNSILKKS